MSEQEGRRGGFTMQNFEQENLFFSRKKLKMNPVSGSLAHFFGGVVGG